MIVYLTAWASVQLAIGQRPSVGRAFIASATTLAPMGLLAWAAILTPTLMVNATFVLVTALDPFGWNWNLFGTGGMPWRQVWPSGIPLVQACCVLAGLGWSVRLAVRAMDGRMKAAMPLAMLLTLTACGFLVLFLN
jgi:hypothetical protein